MCESVTGWSDTIEQLTLIDSTKLEDTYSLGAWINATLSAVEYYTISTVDMSSGTHVYIWMNCSGIPDTKANGGYRIVLYTDSSNYATFYVGGSDTHGTGWLLMCCDASATPNDETGTFDPSDVTRIGVQFNVTTAAVKQGQVFVYNVFWDAVRYGTGSVVTSGATDDADYEDIYIDEVNDNYYGVVQKIYGSYIQTGKIILGGTSTETCDFVIDNEIIIFPSNDKVGSDFYEILPLGNTTNPTYVDISGSVIKAAGSEKFTFDCSGANINTLSVVGNTIDNAADCTFQSGQTITSNVFTGCGAIDPNLGTSEGSLMINAAGDATAAIDLIFSDYTGATTYAVYVASGVTEIDMDNWVFDDPNNTTSYALYWAGAAGTLTINATNGTNLVDGGCTSAGGTVTVVSNPVTCEITVKDTATPPIALENARVLLKVSNGDNYPYQASVNIVSTGTTATVTHADHGMATDDYIVINGANEDAYNGVYQITYVGDSSYTYTMGSDPVSPATGTIIGTFAVISGDTNASGIVSDTRTWSVDQDITGWARKSTDSPYYRQSGIVGTIDKDSGLTVIAQLISDE